MSTASLNLELRSSLMQTGLLQPVSQNDNPKNFWVLCRIVPGQEPAWLVVVESVLVEFDAAPWEGVKPDLIIARRYVVKDGRMVFGWYISIIAKTVKDLELMIRLLQSHLENARPVLTDAEEGFVPQATSQPKARHRTLAPGAHPAPRAPVPRPPGPVLAHPNPPEGFIPSITMVKKEVHNGVLSTIEEMPLPHIYKEMNVPNEKRKGAWHDGTFHVTGGKS